MTMAEIAAATTRVAIIATVIRAVTGIATAAMIAAAAEAGIATGETIGIRATTVGGETATIGVMAGAGGIAIITTTITTGIDLTGQ